VDRALGKLKLPWVYAKGIARHLFGIKKLECLAPEQLPQGAAAPGIPVGEEKWENLK